MLDILDNVSRENVDKFSCPTELDEFNCPKVWLLKLDWASAGELLLISKTTKPNPITINKLYIIFIVNYHNI